MADRLDVAGRLVDGGPAVEHTQSYVRACRALGYRHPDLTASPSQVRDWYDSEEGLDLYALDRDCAELRAAGAAVEEGLRMQRTQLAELAAVWTGPGANGAIAFLQRHCDAATTVAAEVRAAAQRCESLRDNLWFLLDSKVAAAIAIDDRTRVQRPVWLTAAAAVAHGVGERSAAEQTVRQQIGPYVDNDIRDEWLTTMRSTVDGIAASYDMVIDRMAAAPAAYFEVPGDFGPACQPAELLRPNTPAAASVTPAAAVPGPPADLPPAAPAAPPVPEVGTALGDASSGVPAGDLGGLGGLSGLASRIVDAMSGLLGSTADQLADPSALDDLGSGGDPSDRTPFRPDDVGDDIDDTGEEPEPGVEEVDRTRDSGDAQPDEQAQPGDAPPPGDEPPPTDEKPTPADTPPTPVAAPAPAAPPTGEAVPAADETSTPCEIATDQLPQAGR